MENQPSVSTFDLETQFDNLVESAMTKEGTYAPQDKQAPKQEVAVQSSVSLATIRSDSQSTKKSTPEASNGYDGIVESSSSNMKVNESVQISSEVLPPAQNLVVVQSSYESEDAMGKPKHSSENEVINSFLGPNKESVGAPSQKETSKSSVVVQATQKESISVGLEDAETPENVKVKDDIEVDDDSLHSSEEKKEEEPKIKPASDTSFRKNSGVGTHVVTRESNGVFGYQVCYIRHKEERFPMTSSHRFKMKLKRLLLVCCRKKDNTVETRPKVGKSLRNYESVYGNVSNDKYRAYVEQHPIQYNITRTEPGSYLERKMGVRWSELTIFRADEIMENVIIRIFEDMLSMSFFMLLIIQTLAFLMITAVFAGLIYLADQVEQYSLDAAQIEIGGGCFGIEDGRYGIFSEAYELSWTTFSTVGYGTVKPDYACKGVTGLCVVESFLGVIYASACGAVLFTKLLNIQSRAQVVFSDPICVHLGEEAKRQIVTLKGAFHALKKSVACASGEEERLYECPYIEIRLVNKMANNLGGEIRGANIVCTVAFSNAVSEKSSRRASGLPFIDDPTMIANESFLKRKKSKSNKGVKMNERYAMKHLEANSDAFSYEKLKLECDSRPIFNHIWSIRHRLDEKSPLLRPRAKYLVGQHKGKWPANKQNHESIRASMKDFKYIYVTLSGVSGTTLSEVYAKKVYEPIDFVYGYEFSPAHFYDHEKDLHLLDFELINDVQEQYPGSGESMAGNLNISIST